MKRKGTYRATEVERFDVARAVVELGGGSGCVVAIDVAKTKFVAAVSTTAGEVVRLVKFEHPRQTGMFLALLKALADGGKKPSIVMEPTGTYGDAVRYQCHRAGYSVHMMPPKHTSDFAEIIDGVPSMHDGKAAVVLAKLHAVKPGRLWTPASEEKRNLRAWVDQRKPLGKTQALYYGQMEAELSRHWPEAWELVDVYGKTWIALLKEYPGARAVAADVEGASELLRRASRQHFTGERIEALVRSAQTTMGVPTTPVEEEKLRAIATVLEAVTKRLEDVDKELAKLVKADESLSLMARVVGPVCAAATGALIGKPEAYSCARAYEKAMGLNLKEKSSGAQAGQLRITKRGPGQVRHLMYLAALRFLKEGSGLARAWYSARKSREGGQALKAVVAVMRKLARALWHVGRGDPFDVTKLFDSRRLQPEADARTGVTGLGASVINCEDSNRHSSGQLTEMGEMERRYGDRLNRHR